MNIDFIVSLIKQSLCDDLLKPEYKKLPNRHPTTGHCYIAAEAAFHLIGGKEFTTAFCGRDSDNCTHWWLKNKTNGTIIDPTIEQYTFFGETPPYKNGKPCGFLTKRPSKRCQIVIDRVRERLNDA